MGECFYKDGLRFECQRCLYCCSAEPGYVYLSRNDIERAAGKLSLPPRKFIDAFCRLVDFGTFYMVSLKEMENYDCIFLTPSGCAIYDARPRQCRTYPFWDSVMESRESWEKEALSCPGIGKGGIIPKKEIERRMRSKEQPYMILKGKEIWQP